MSRSKQGRDIDDTSTEKDVEQTSNQSTTDTFNQRNETRNQYTPGRESWREFPRRQPTSGGVGQEYRQSSGQQTSGGYERRRGDDRWSSGQANPYGNRGTSGYRNEYDNRNRSREDTGDFYSQGIRQGVSGNRQYEDPYRAYERGNQPQGYQSSGQRQNYGDYNRNQQTGGQNYQPYNQQYDREGSYRNQRDSDYNRNNRNYRSEENRNYRPEDFENTRETQGGQYQNDYPNYNVDRADPAMYSLEYGYASGYPFGGAWYGNAEAARQQVLRCRDVMTKDVTTCMPQTTIREVADKMEDENIGSLPVVENGRLIGIITDRDIVCRVLAEGHDSRTATVKEAMSDDIIICSPDETVVDAIHKMGEHQIRRLPVCDNNGRLRGIISIGDLALEAENDREIARALEHISQSTPYQARRR